MALHRTNKLLNYARGWRVSGKPRGYAGSIVSGLLLPMFFVSIVEAENKYVGVGSCGSSNCHGSISPKSSSRVLQNEYTTWFRHEAHSRAYEILTNDHSKRIAKHLGIGAAEKADICLDCHATNVPAKLRGNRFRISDGVGCESCHGAAEKYLGTHTAKDRPFSENVKDGLIDLSSLENRARICMDCHVGNDKQKVDHRLIGAGHPRLTFELDTFSMLQPNHWQIDDDYIKRKARYVPAQAWLVGQAYRGREMLAALTSKTRSKFGVLPELSLFNCYSCHHSLSEQQWKERTYGGRPGELHLNVSSLVVLREGLKVLAPAQATELDAQLKALAAAYPLGEERAVVDKLQGLLNSSIIPNLKKQAFNKEQTRSLMRSVVSYAASTPFLPYEIAEQCAMATSALSVSLDPNGTAFQKQIDGLYNSLKNEKEFKPREFTAAAGKFLEALKN